MDVPSFSDVVDCQIKLVVMSLNLSAVFGFAIRQHPQHRQFMLNEERQNLVIEQVSRRDRRLGRIELREGHLGVGIDKSLLINATNAFHRADIESVL